MSKRLVPVDANGNAVGQYHHRAKLTDEQVELIRDLHEEGAMGYRTLARYFGVSRETIKKICRFERRATHAEAWVRR